MAASQDNVDMAKLQVTLYLLSHHHEYRPVVAGEGEWNTFPE